jgi:ABC-type lipoprotein export system ATPase subunit
MFVERLIVREFRQLRDVDIGPLSAPADNSELVVLAGPNGSGKSSLLELLSFGLATRYSRQYYQARDMSNHSFAIRIGISDAQLAELELAQEDSAVIQYARRERGYWFQVNHPGVVPPAEQQVNDRIHSIVSRQFQNFTQKLGFFLRADRGYSSRAYNRSDLWSWRNKIAPAHWQNLSYGNAGAQYNDMYDFLVEQGFHYILQLGTYTKNAERGAPSPRPVDPLTQYNALLGQIFPGYSFVDTTPEDLTLRVQLPTGNAIPFQDLSSGEKEVFFILSFFLRHDISDSVIVIDEPELHLHPELARKLIQLMRTIRPHNQIWSATHSAELIDEAGRDHTYYLRQNEQRTQATCVPATKEGVELEHLRNMFGYSGFVGISKKIVFLEGEGASADRKTFSVLFGGAAREVKLIPVGGWQNLYRINAAVLALLQSDFARCSFFLIRDRDYLSLAAVAKYAAAQPGRLFVLGRYHIENYLLNDHLIASALARVYQKTIQPADIARDLRLIARQNSAAFYRDLVVSKLAELYQSEDFSIGNHSANLSLIGQNDAVDENIATPLMQALRQHATAIVADVHNRTSADAVEQILRNSAAEVIGAFASGSDGWRGLFPGRYLLQRFSTANGLGAWPALQNILIDELAKHPELMHSDLRDIVNAIGANG